MFIIRIVLIIFLSSTFAYAKHIHPEKYYQNLWCQEWKGQQEVKLIDETRVDCLTKTYATEFDFAKKWAEAIGQSLHYSRMTGKKPAIVLIIEKPDDFKYYNRIKPLCSKYNIALWYMQTPKESENYNYIGYEQILDIILAYVKNVIISLL